MTTRTLVASSGSFAPGKVLFGLLGCFPKRSPDGVHGAVPTVSGLPEPGTRGAGHDWLARMKAFAKLDAGSSSKYYGLLACTGSS